MAQESASDRKRRIAELAALNKEVEGQIAQLDHDQRNYTKLEVKAQQDLEMSHQILDTTVEPLLNEARSLYHSLSQDIHEKIEQIQTAKDEIERKHQSFVAMKSKVNQRDSSLHTVHHTSHAPFCAR